LTFRSYKYNLKGSHKLFQLRLCRPSGTMGVTWAYLEFRRGIARRGGIEKLIEISGLQQ
jgi:hypothetical protein